MFTQNMAARRVVPESRVCTLRTEQYDTIDELKDAVRRTFQQITPAMLRRMSHRIWRRIILCEENDGDILTLWKLRTRTELKRQSVRSTSGRSRSVLYAVCLSTLAAGMDMERRFNKGLLLMDIMPHRTTINSDAYVATLKKLQARLSRVRRHRENQDVLLLHDNAQP
ncbi:hypothetical protein ANN_13964 [Periplaneta americana]|uniref:Uncharacterized protein n=1 Tax=Periplaneta americana TaxID=6978 RepID=A0ABQ8SV00_PERAM|nr:hypothetical protein ANN_13964 [Periplaneta americana]